MSFPRYERYKDSGVAWLGEVPEQWDMQLLKHVVSTPITDGPHETPEFLDIGVPFVSAEAVSSGRLNFDKIRGFISQADHARYGQKFLPRRDDIFIIKSGATTGVTAIVDTDKEFNIWSPLAVIRCGAMANPRFILNFLRSRNFLDAVSLSWSFGTQQNIGMGVIENLALPLPPVREQAEISYFLDAESAKINTLIEEQRRLIALLKEKRQAVISHAVTKGLNPAAPMKDSGVSWIGQVPDNGIVLSAKRISKIFVPQRNKPELNSTCDGTRWITMENMKEGGIRASTTWVSNDAANDAGIRVLHPGAVIASCVGNFGVAIINEVTVVINQQLQAFIPRNEVLPTFLRYWVMSAKSYFEQIGNAATLIYVNQEGFADMPLVLPPLEDQSNVVDFLDGKTNAIDSLTAKANEVITLLQERRSALISAAVTGKIDVRNYASSKTEVPEEVYELA